ncbi:hypothetical protein KIPB_014992, partial [Kipferlia bialata]|eukprot:g14992.t1
MLTSDTQWHTVIDYLAPCFMGLQETFPDK